MSKYPSLEVDLESQLAKEALLADLESRLATLEAAVFYDPPPRCKHMCFAVSNSCTNTALDDPAQIDDSWYPF